jgi:hypothetical protein
MSLPLQSGADPRDSPGPRPLFIFVNIIEIDCEILELGKTSLK